MPTYPTYKLGEVADYINGRAFKPSEWKEKGLPIVRIQNLNDENAEYHYSDVTHEDKYLLHNGDLLFAWAASLGTYIWNSGDAWLNQHIFKVIPKENVSKKYLYYALTSIIKELYAKSHGSGMVHVTKDKFVNTEIPLPPLPTQHAIVSRIESLFAELDKAEEHLRTAQQQLKIYRQAVLNHWLNNDEGKWEMVKLKDIADVNTGSTPKRGNNDYWENGTIPWITSGETNNQHITKASEFITAKAIAETNCKIIPKGSLVIAMYGEGKTRGKCAELSIDAATNQALASITFTNTEISKNFAKWFFEKNYQDMRLLSSGGVQPNLNLGIIKNMIIPFPPISEQQRIVAEIESRLSQAEAVEASIEKALQQSEALRQSILKKAFGGELVVSTGSTTANCG